MEYECIVWYYDCLFDYIEFSIKFITYKMNLPKADSNKCTRKQKGNSIKKYSEYKNDGQWYCVMVVVDCWMSTELDGNRKKNSDKRIK